MQTDGQAKHRGLADFRATPVCMTFCVASVNVRVLPSSLNYNDYCFYATNTSADVIKVIKLGCYTFAYINTSYVSDIINKT